MKTHDFLEYIRNVGSDGPENVAFVSSLMEQAEQSRLLEARPPEKNKTSVSLKITPAFQKKVILCTVQAYAESSLAFLACWFFLPGQIEGLVESFGGTKGQADEITKKHYEQASHFGFTYKKNPYETRVDLTELHGKQRKVIRWLESTVEAIIAIRQS